MALTFTNTEATTEGLEITNAYARVGVRDNESGETLDTTVSIYVNEAAYANGKNPIGLLESATETGLIKSFFQFPYDRATDGTDILSIAHTELKAYFDADGHPVTIDLT